MINHLQNFRIENQKSLFPNTLRSWDHPALFSAGKVSRLIHGLSLEANDLFRFRSKTSHGEPADWVYLL